MKVLAQPSDEQFLGTSEFAHWAAKAADAPSADELLTYWNDGLLVPVAVAELT